MAVAVAVAVGSVPLLGFGVVGAFMAMATTLVLVGILSPATTSEWLDGTARWALEIISSVADAVANTPPWQMGAVAGAVFILVNKVGQVLLPTIWGGGRR